MKISVGRIVHYVHEPGGQHFAALVTQARPLCVAVFAPMGYPRRLGENGWAFPEEVTLASDSEDPTGMQAFSWHWPEREAE